MKCVVYKNDVFFIEIKYAITKVKYMTEIWNDET